MKELSIRINIAGRVYPLTIEPTEEERIKKAVEQIKEDLDIVEASYSIKDKQDLLAILAFQYCNSVELLKLEKTAGVNSLNELHLIDKKLETFLASEY